jgi:hypothetical protein
LAETTRAHAKQAHEACRWLLAQLETLPGNVVLDVSPAPASGPPPKVSLGDAVATCVTMLLPQLRPDLQRLFAPLADPAVAEQVVGQWLRMGAVRLAALFLGRAA